MSLLQDLLAVMRKNLLDKGKTPVETYIIIEKVRKKYKDEKFWTYSDEKIEEVIKEDTREKRLLALSRAYQDHGKVTGEWVFEPTSGSINDQYEFGRTLLHIAILEKNIVEIKQLVTQGINTKIKDNGGLTPFQVAIIEDDKEIISLLENLGVI